LVADRAFIFGAGGHAHVIASMIDGDVTFLVPGVAGQGEMSEAEFFGRIDDVGHARIYVGIGSNEIRRSIFVRLTQCGVRVANLIGPNTYVARTARLGQGVVLCPGSVVGARAVIGDNTIVNTLSSVDHDCVLGDHSQVTAGVTFGGSVKVGANCFFGLKSVVLPDKSIGNNVSVMAGSLVATDLPDNVVVGGNPARVMRSIEPQP
jgi:sugar O-acyltransferase (sialic acid O-acetyltransferase NeuD family)